MTLETVEAMFHMRCGIVKDPLFGTPLILPHGKGRKVDKRLESAPVSTLVSGV